jgi:hypothetical protein
VVLFNASSRLGGLSQNAVFTLLTGWGLQLAGVPVIHFACHEGMTRCVLGTNPDDPKQDPPCKACISQTKKLIRSAETRWFGYQRTPMLTAALEGLSLEELRVFEFSQRLAITEKKISLPLGKLVLPSLRWALRRHHLKDDKATRYLYREYIKSAYRVMEEFSSVLIRTKPQAVVLFNGLQFPEAAARWVARRVDIRVISHEVGFQPFSAFFSDEQVTAYPMDISEVLELSPEQQKKIDAHLSRRFQGEFTMAGIKFWPDMKGLSDDFLKRADRFRQVIPIFTNVIFDTSQVHANTIFPNMFSWLNMLLDVIQRNSDTLFVIRAHPDEMRKGKESRESVQAWVTANSVNQFKNVDFVTSGEALSSYDLIYRSKFVMVYNSSIGLEASLLGIPVLCGGKARYTQFPTVFLPQSPEEYLDMAERFLSEDEIKVPPEYQRNARRILYHQFYRSSLLLGKYMEAHPTPGYVQLRPFSWRELLVENSPSLRVIVNGILNSEPFLMPDK